MGQPICCLGDLHVCNITIPPTPASPAVKHLGGPVVQPGQAIVRVMGRPVAVVTGMTICMNLITPPGAPPVPTPDPMVKGSMMVKICGLPVMRISDKCSHGGTMSTGNPLVKIAM
ncbi:PAAR domain-containing protein [Sagittula sp. S175]|uniref:PAAR domain-containing protein n=1 Tax=Sagittula sp. S175 TaxID=3415129 RepID=UPI003C7E8C51